MRRRLPRNWESAKHTRPFFDSLLLRASCQRLDAIVAFSGLEAFLDEPLRTYSSGMVARLGFSVAAHLDPDILLIDEILAVGDAIITRAM